MAQIRLISLYFISLGMAWEKHGQAKEGTHSWWTALIALVIQMGLLWWGGFFEGMF